MNDARTDQDLLTKDQQRVMKQLRGLVEEEPNQTANLANASALLMQFLERVNWVGFYLPDTSGELVLGPFQGLPACIRIPMGEGVCGTAAKEAKTIRVQDVHAFPGHIACDAASQSEIVVPMYQDGSFIGLLDIDSPQTGRFSEADEIFLKQFANELSECL